MVFISLMLDFRAFFFGSYTFNRRLNTVLNAYMH